MFFLHLLCSNIIIVIVITLITAVPIITVTIWVNWMLSYPEGKGKHWEARWWVKMQRGKKQPEYHFCFLSKVSPKEPKADSWGTEEGWTAGAWLMAQPRAGWEVKLLLWWCLNFLLILLLISFFFFPSPSTACSDVLWAGVTSRCSHQLQDLTHRKCQEPWVPHWGSACCFHAWSWPSNAHNNKKAPNYSICLRGHSSPLCSGCVTPDALLQSCPSLNQLVSGSVNVTARLPQQQSPDVGGRLAGEKRKKNPSSQKKNPSSQPCCCSNQASSCLLLSNMALCPSPPLS